MPTALLNTDGAREMEVSDITVETAPSPKGDAWAADIKITLHGILSGSMEIVVNHADAQRIAEVITEAVLGAAR